MLSANAETNVPGQVDLVDNKLSQQVQTTVAEVGKALLGKEHQIRLALCCLFSGGHLLIEDLPGMGKTTLSYALAKALVLVITVFKAPVICYRQIYWASQSLIKLPASFHFIPGLFLASSCSPMR